MKTNHAARTSQALCIVMLVFAGLLLVACAGADLAPPPSDAAEADEPTPVLLVTVVAVAPTPTAVPPPPGPLEGRRICLDPGHDAYWVAGASGYNRAGQVPIHPTELIPLHEHELTLAVSYRLKALLEGEGAQVCVTRKPRSEGGGTYLEPYDYTGDGRVRTAGQAIEDNPERIQPRIDWANAFQAELLLSIHFNGLDDKRVRGSEVYFSDTGPRLEEGRRLGRSVLSGLLAHLQSAGFATTDRGVLSDAYQRYGPAEMARMLATHASILRAKGVSPDRCPDCYRLATLGNNPMSLHRGEYLAAMVEVEFLSNPDVVEGLIMRPDGLDIIARGLFFGLRGFFESQ